MGTIHRAKGDKDMKPKHWNEEMDNRLREMWSFSYLKDIAFALGCSVNTIRSHVQLLGLQYDTKSAYYKERRAETNRQAAIKAGKRPQPYTHGHKHTEEVKWIIGEKRHNLYAAERRRVLFGLPQKTNIKVKV